MSKRDKVKYDKKTKDRTGAVVIRVRAVYDSDQPVTALRKGTIAMAIKGGEKRGPYNIPDRKSVRVTFRIQKELLDDVLQALQQRQVENMSTLIRRLLVLYLQEQDGNDNAGNTRNQTILHQLDLRGRFR